MFTRRGELVRTSCKKTNYIPGESDSQCKRKMKACPTIHAEILSGHQPHEKNPQPRIRKDLSTRESPLAVTENIFPGCSTLSAWANSCGHCSDAFLPHRRIFAT